ncbi:MAG: hypothetical protein WC683_09180 [bacterium]
MLILICNHYAMEKRFEIEGKILRGAQKHCTTAVIHSSFFNLLDIVESFREDGEGWNVPNKRAMKRPCDQQGLFYCGRIFICRGSG